MWYIWSWLLNCPLSLFQLHKKNAMLYPVSPTKSLDPLQKLHFVAPGTVWSMILGPEELQHVTAEAYHKNTHTHTHTHTAPLRITPITKPGLKLCATPPAFKVSQNGKIAARIRRLRIIWFWRACYQALLHWKCLQNAQLLQQCHIFQMPANELHDHTRRCKEISWIFQNIAIAI